MKVKSITYSGKADVYNMEVDDTHDFAIENGVIAHNCYDSARYVCMEHPLNPRSAVNVIDQVYDPFRTDDDKPDRFAFYRI